VTGTHVFSRQSQAQAALRQLQNHLGTRGILGKHPGEIHATYLGQNDQLILLGESPAAVMAP